MVYLKSVAGLTEVYNSVINDWTWWNSPVKVLTQPTLSSPERYAYIPLTSHRSVLLFLTLLHILFVWLDILARDTAWKMLLSISPGWACLSNLFHAHWKIHIVVHRPKFQTRRMLCKYLSVKRFHLDTVIRRVLVLLEFIKHYLFRLYSQCRHIFVEKVLLDVREVVAKRELWRVNVLI